MLAALTSIRLSQALNTLVYFAIGRGRRSGRFENSKKISCRMRARRRPRLRMLGRLVRTGASRRAR